MSQHVPDTGCRALLDLLSAAWGSSLLVHLFRADHTPAASDVVASYTEANFEGYVAQAATAWSAAVTIGGVTFAFAEELEFLKGIGGVGNDVYGYFVTDAGGTVLLWAERDPNAPVDMSVDGNSYWVTPRFRAGSAA